MSTALIHSETVAVGVLTAILGIVFYSSQSRLTIFQKFYQYVPALLLCYFLPSLLTTFDIIESAVSDSLYKVAKLYFLPTCLVLLTLNIDFKSIMGLGPKAIIMFLTGTVGIMIGGPIALLVTAWLFPEAMAGQGPEAVWRGLTTLAGSWIGGGANQAAMKEVFEVGDDIFSTLITVDIVVANFWMAILLYMASKHKAIDKKVGADTSGIETLRRKVEKFERENSRIPSLHDLIYIVAFGFGVCGLAHWGADLIAPWMKVNVPWGAEYSLHSPFLWLVLIATTVGVAASFTRVRSLESVGASKVGSLCLYFLVATIGLHMDITRIMEAPKFLFLGVIWMAVHAILMLVVARLIKAPVFYMAVGSQANVGAAASAPVVAAAFHPALAPVGVLLAILGYALGTYMAYLCGIIMSGVPV